MITLELAKYGYKITNKLYPNTLHWLAESSGGLKMHHYPTCYKKTPNIQKHKTKDFNNSHLCKGISVSNNLPKRLKDIKLMECFIRELKKISHKLLLTTWHSTFIYQLFVIPLS